jgi:hypothetical protein
MTPAIAAVSGRFSQKAALAAGMIQTGLLDRRSGRPHRNRRRRLEICATADFSYPSSACSLN